MRNNTECAGGAMPPGPEVRVLLVDHDDRLRQSLTQALTEYGCQVLAAENGEYALQVIDREPVDIVFTDILMPKMDGLEMIRHLAKVRPALPVIAMSDHVGSSVNYLRFALSFGAIEALPKPFEIDAALEIVRRHTAPA